MLRLYAFISGILLLASSSVFSQSASIQINNDAFQAFNCIGTAYRLPVTTTGTFNSGNKFTVQIRKNQTSNILGEVSASLVDGILQLTFSDSLAYANSEVLLRAVSSSPKAESLWSNPLVIHSKGNVTLNSTLVSDTLNRFDEGYIRFTGQSLSTVNVTLDDSSRFSIYTNAFNFTSDEILHVGKSEPYTIAHAENVCGAMKVGGSYQRKLNNTSVKTISFLPQSVCENGEVKITFSTFGDSFNSQTKYRLRFMEASSNTKPRIAEVEATLTGQVLTAKVPAQFKADPPIEVYVQIITTNPATVSSRSAEKLMIWPAPSAYLNSTSRTVNMGDPIQVDVNVKGLPPFTAEFTNGSTVSSWNSTLQFQTNALKDQSYTLKSLSSGCGKMEIKEMQTAEIKVRPGIRIEENDMPQILCVGSKGKIKFTTNANLTDGTRFTIKMTNATTGEVMNLPATRSGDFVELTLPVKSGGYAGYIYQIVTTNPAMISQESQYIVGQTLPNVQFSGYNFNYNYSIPSDIRLNYILTGGAPHTVEYMDGSVVEYQHDGGIITQEFFLKETMDFKIKSISNSCFKNENVQVAKLTVTPAQNPGIYLESISKAVCNDDSVEIVFGTVGKFNEGNRFIIQGFTNCCDFQDFMTVDKPGKYKFKVSAKSFFVNNGVVRIASTSPAVVIETKTFTVQGYPSNITLYPPGRPEDPYRILKTDPQRTMSISAALTPISKVTYTENGIEKTFVSDQTQHALYVPISPKLAELTPYEIKSVTNECGTVEVSLKTYAITMPYNIQLSNFGSGLKYCAGAPIEIPFGIVDGIASDATFSLQLGPDGSSDFQSLVSGEKDRILKAVIPATTPDGLYYLRIVSSDGAVSPPLRTLITRPPTATLRYLNETGQPQPEPITVDAGERVRFEVTFTGSYPWDISWKDNTFNRFFYQNQQTIDFFPTQNQEFSITSVSNECGYGTMSGTAKVKVKPKLNVSSASASVCEGGQLKVYYNLLGEVDLSDDYVRFVLVNRNNAAAVTLDSVKSVSGTIDLKIPKNLTGNFYQILVTVSKYGLMQTIPVSVAILPGLTISGNTSINAGSSAQLILKSTRNNFESIKYTLSDGTTGDAAGDIGAVNYIRVSPKQTTTYTISSVSNACGPGVGSGSAVVEVNAVSARSVNVTQWSSLTSLGFCTGDTISVSYAASGTFSAGNKMTVQISDTTGRNWRNIVTPGNTNPLKAVLPLDLFTGKHYAIRVSASDEGTASGAYEFPLVADKKARAKFGMESVLHDGKTNPRITVLLEGGSPWRYTYGTDFPSLVRQTSNPVDEIVLYQAQANQVYRLFEVFNGCGAGIIDNPSTVKVEVITGLEPNLTALKVTAFPNPTEDFLTLEFENEGEKVIRLMDSNGRILRNVSTKQQKEIVDIQALSSGIYILKVESNERQSSFKVVKR